jgi:hypothetical protein
MPVNISDPQAEALLRELIEKTGETELQAIARSIRERLQRMSIAEDPNRLFDILNELARSYSRQASGDKGDPEAILGYDENGLPR